MPILLFFWIFCKYQLDKFGWLYYSNFLCPYWFSILLITESIIFKSPNIIVLISFFSSSFIFSLENNYFTILWWFLLYIDMNQPWVHMCPPILNPPSHLPPHTIPLGCPRAPTLGTLLHALNLHWSSILHMVIYIFQCYSLKSFHPCLLPESKSLFFTSVSLLLPCIWNCYCLSKFHIYMC